MHDEIFLAIQNEFGPQAVALYLVGSYGTQRAMAGSDVDYVLVCEPAFAQSDYRRLGELLDRLRAIHHPHIDIRPAPLQQVLARGVGIKLQGRFLGGQDIRDDIRTPAPRERISHLCQVALMFVRKIHGIEEVDVSSLRYPAAKDPYRGYVEYENERPLSPLMSLSFLATAFLARRFSIFITDKHELPGMMNDRSDRDSAQWIRWLFATARGQWALRIPEDPASQMELREYCRLALHFERAMLRALAVIEPGSH